MMRIFILFLLFSLPLLGARECEDYTEQLLSQWSRPTMAQVAWLAQICGENPLASVGISHRRLDALRKETEIVTAIAAFEGAFPGATFYPLGRDAVYVGDIFDGFYRSLGQNDRVRRLDASHPSFSEDDFITYRFMKTNGIDMIGIEQGFPHVMFDVTSFAQTGGVGGGASQSVQLIHAGYAAYERLGKDPKNLVPLLNFISIGGFWKHSLSLADPKFNVDAFLEQQRKSTGRHGFVEPFFCDLNGFTYTEEWHGIFEKFVTGVEGVGAPKGAIGPLGRRREILAEMFELNQIVSDDRFYGAVRVAALLRGYEFPVVRTRTLHRYPAKVVGKIEEHVRDAKKPKVSISVSQKHHAWITGFGVTPAGAQYLENFLLRQGDRKNTVAALSFVFEDIQTSSLHVTEVDVEILVRAALGGTVRKKSKELARYLIEQSATLPLLANVLARTAELTPLGEKESARFDKNITDLILLRSRAKGSCPEEIAD